MRQAATVYLITNQINGNTYIGITRFSSHKRWLEHVYTASRSPRTRLHRAIKKYGKENFCVTDVACAIASPALVEREAIKSFSPEYNQTNGGEITSGRRVSKETIEKIRLANTGKVRTQEQREEASRIKKLQYQQRPELLEKARASIAKAAISLDREKQKKAASISSKNRVWTDDSRQKLSSSRMGIRHSKEVLAKIAEKKNKLVECSTLGILFDSVSEAAEMTGLSISGVSSVCRLKRRSANGLVFRFLEE